ncbi:glycosyltransferase [Gammaproteobacteria bacterium LSUCC0057]|uniref:Glycosyltransferase n=1 Tax=Gammaproteobacteria bacterium LSUCC0057 TaxID=2559237 RepID=A0A4Y8UJL1_9GAMM|nr:glycosyltransferase [Gammaproteobacteria bacterium LSUCC0057]
MSSTAFITTCKGRLAHLQQSLPRVVAQQPDEIIVVDYGCPEGAGRWVEENFPTVKVVYVTDDPSFCAARARNIGSRAATADWLFLFDADIVITADLFGWLAEQGELDSFYRASRVDGRRVEDSWGSVICARRHFEKLHGYDESFRGWGGEDDDLYLRLRLLGAREVSYPSELIAVISHDESLRMSFYQQKTKRAHQHINRLYRQAKGQLIALQHFNPVVPQGLCLDLRKRVEQGYQRWHQRGCSEPLKIAFSFNLQMELNRGDQLQQNVETTLTLSVE